MIVFDASTLILLAKIGLLEPFLAGCGMEAGIPEKVEAESCEAKKTFDALLIRKAIDERKIRTVRVKDPGFVNKLRDDFGLGDGEAEAIALAVQAKASLVAIDDKNGINACKLLDIGFTTAAGILVVCYEKELITAREALQKVEQLAKHGRYRNSIIEDVRSRLEAGK
jgi:predicted nucleic acid-binding protein